MTRMQRLKAEARETASLLGHTLARFRQSVVTSGSSADPPRAVAVAACKVCGVLVAVDPGAPGAEGRVTGEGVLRHCYAIEQEGHESA